MNEAALMIAVKSMAVLLKVNPDEVRDAFNKILNSVATLDARIATIEEVQKRILALLEEKDGRLEHGIVNGSGSERTSLSGT